jgi:hypothetical protein
MTTTSNPPSAAASVRSPGVTWPPPSPEFARDTTLPSRSELPLMLRWPPDGRRRDAVGRGAAYAAYRRRRCGEEGVGECDWEGVVDPGRLAAAEGVGVWCVSSDWRKSGSCFCLFVFGMRAHTNAAYHA